jgi:23S rRNA pseudouridine955/2504/2580 synthase
MTDDERGASAAPGAGVGVVATVAVAAEDTGLRLDRWFRRHYPAIGHARLERWLRLGQVRVDGHRVRAGVRLAAGQVIRIPPLADGALGTAPAGRHERPPALSAAERDLLAGRLLHQDEHVIVIDKPAGLPVQGGSGVTRSLDALLAGLAGAGERPRLVHRLDKDTSGVLVLARTPAAAAQLAAAFRARTVRKLYWAIVVGAPAADHGRIEAPVGKRPADAGERVMVDVDAGSPAVTLFRVRARAGRRAAWLALEPLTGRTHQLRVHCLALGTPILGDGKYGGRSAFLAEAGGTARLHLHARAIAFPHPAGGLCRVVAPLPEHMRDGWAFFGFADESAEKTLADWPDAPAGRGAAPSGTRRHRPGASRPPAPRRYKGKKSK